MAFANIPKFGARVGSRATERSSSTASTSAASTDVAMEGAATSSFFSDLSNLGSDVIESWSQHARNAGQTMFNSKIQRRRVGAPATGDGAGEDVITYVSDAPECFSADQVQWLDFVVNESLTAGLNSGLK